MWNVFLLMYLLCFVITEFDIEESILMEERREGDRRKKWGRGKEDSKVKEGEKRVESEFGIWGI